MFKALHDKLDRLLEGLESVHEAIVAMRRELRALGVVDAGLASVVAQQATQGAHTMTTLNDLADKVAQNTNVEASAIQVLQALQKQLADAGTDPAKLDALAAQLDASTSALAQAIAFNTVAGPNPHPGLAPSPVTPSAPAPAAPPAGIASGPFTAGVTDTTASPAQAAPLPTSIALPPGDQTSTSTVTGGGHAAGSSNTPGDTIADAKTDAAAAPSFGQGAKAPSTHPKAR